MTVKINSEQRKTLKAGVHFSAKYTHSSAAGFGVRLSKRAATKLPYFSVSRAILAGKALPVDFVTDAAINIQDFKALNEMFGFGEAGSPTSPIAVLNEKVHATVGDDDAIGTHLKQILFPLEDGDYRCLIPLSSAGFAGAIREHSRAIEDAEESAFFLKSHIPYGGSHPTNAGGLTHKLHYVLTASAPKEDPSVRHAFSLYYKGPQILLFNADLLKLREAMNRREGLYRYLGVCRIVYPIIEQALRKCVEDKVVLELHQDKLPEGDLFHASVPDVLQGLMTSHHDVIWQAEFADHLAKRIAHHRFKNKDIFGLPTAAEQMLSTTIFRMLKRVIAKN